MAQTKRTYISNITTYGKGDSQYNTVRNREEFRRYGCPPCSSLQ